VSPSTSKPQDAFKVPRPKKPPPEPAPIAGGAMVDVPMFEVLRCEECGVWTTISPCRACSR
jgi:hypothetical protein